MIKAIQCQKLPIDTLQYNKKVFNSILFQGMNSAVHILIYTSLTMDIMDIGNTQIVQFFL